MASDPVAVRRPSTALLLTLLLSLGAWALPAAAQLAPEAAFVVPSPREDPPPGGLVAAEPPTVATLADGSWIVTWGVAVEAGNDAVLETSMVARRLTPSGTPGEGTILTTVESGQGLGVQFPRVAALGASPAGPPGFAAAWTRLLQAGNVLEARSDLSAPLTLSVPTPDPTALSSPAIAASGERYLVAWEQQSFQPGASPNGTSVTAFQVLGRDGELVGSPGVLAQLADQPLFILRPPAVAAIPEEVVGRQDFWVVWRQGIETATDTDAGFLRARRVGLDGVPGEPAVRLGGPGGTSLQGNPAVAWDLSPAFEPVADSFVVAAAGPVVAPPDPFEEGRPMLLQRFAREDGRALGDPVEIGRTRGLGAPILGRDRLGHFLVLWWDGEQTLLQPVNRDLIRQGPPQVLTTAGSGFRFDLPGGLAVSGDRALVTRPAIPGVPSSGSDAAGQLYRILRDDDLCRLSGNLLLCDTAGSGNGFAFDQRFGAAGDTFLLGDLDGDGRDEPCIHRGNRFLCDAAQDGGQAEAAGRFGSPRDEPFLADLDGDGRDEPCVRRGNRLLCDTRNDGGRAEVRVGFGTPSDELLLGDVDGDGRDEPCIVRDGRFRCDTALDGGVGEVQLDLGPVLGDAAVAPRFHLADLDGDGRDDACAQTGDTLLCGLFQPAGGVPVITVTRTVDLEGGTLLLGDLDGF